MTDLEFRPAEYRAGRPRHRRHGGYREMLPSAWTTAGLGLLAGAAAAYLLVPGRQAHPADSAPRRARRRQAGRHAVTGRTVTISKPRSEIYAFWRDAEKLSFMENIERVEKLDDRRLRWTIAAPAGRSVTIETEITEDRPDEEIAWRSVEGSQIEARGRVTFRDAPGDRGTEVAAVIEYVPPGGTLGRMVAKLFQREPAVQARHDLKRLKMLLETGEIATSQNRRAA